MFCIKRYIKAVTLWRKAGFSNGEKTEIENKDIERNKETESLYTYKSQNSQEKFDKKASILEKIKKRRNQSINSREKLAMLRTSQVETRERAYTETLKKMF